MMGVLYKWGAPPLRGGAPHPPRGSAPLAGAGEDGEGDIAALAERGGGVAEGGVDGGGGDVDLGVQHGVLLWCGALSCSTSIPHRGG